MSDLSAIYLRDLRQRYGLTTFVESGCYRGDGIAAALEAGFELALSSDIAPVHAKLSIDRFRGDDRVRITVDSSTSALREQMPLIRGQALFWLDGHFPGHYGLHELESPETKFPLVKELQMIRELRPPFGRDVILADDMRVVDAPDNPRWQPGEVSEYYRIEISIADLTKPFLATHDAVVDCKQEGILVLTPRA